MTTTITSQTKIIFSTNPNCAATSKQGFYIAAAILYAIRTLLGPTRNVSSSEYWYVGVLFSELVQYLSCRVNTNLPKHHLSSAPMQEPQWLSWWEHLRRSRFQFWLDLNVLFFSITVQIPCINLYKKTASGKTQVQLEWFNSITTCNDHCLLLLLCPLYVTDFHTLWATVTMTNTRACSEWRMIVMQSSDTFLDQDNCII